MSSSQQHVHQVRDVGNPTQCSRNDHSFPCRKKTLSYTGESLDLSSCHAARGGIVVGENPLVHEKRVSPVKIHYGLNYPFIKCFATMGGRFQTCE